MEAIIHTKNLNILLRSNYDMCTYLTSSAFYKEVLLSLYKLNTVNQSNTPENLRDEYIFYNKRVKIDFVSNIS